jgi:TrmH family RNA methyltransferase
MSWPLISSPQNERIKAAAKLRDRKGREQQGRILIDGVPEISRAIAAGVKIEQVFLIEDLPREVAAQANPWQAAGASLVTVTAPVMEKLAYGQRQEVAIAIASPPTTDLDQLAAKIKQAKTTPLFLVIEGIEKPGNLGAILRTADATGVSAVLIGDGGTDVYNPNAIRASRGAIFTVPVAAATSDTCLAWLRQQNCRLFAARVDGSEEYTAKDYRQPTAFILGSEAHGLTDRWQGADITPIRLPLLGQIDSLNLSVTAAVLCYEALRQRAADLRSP